MQLELLAQALAPTEIVNAAAVEITDERQDEPPPVCDGQNE